MTFKEAVRQALREEMRADPSVFLLGEDIGRYGGAFGVTAGLLDEFGAQRVRETPISENSFVGVAVGAAICGLRPVVEIMFMDFITLAVDQIVNHAAKLHYIYNGQVCVPLVIRAPAGAGRGYGPSHSQILDALFLGVPGLKIVMPYTPREARGLLRAAIRDNNPVLFIEHKLLYGRRGEVPTDDAPMPIGPAEVLHAGTDVTIVSWGKMLDVVGEALKLLGTEVSAEVINLRTLKPLDDATVMTSVAKTGRLVIVEEGQSCGGVGAEISARIAGGCIEYLQAPIVRVSMPESPIPAARPLEDYLIPRPEQVVEAIRRCRSF